MNQIYFPFSYKLRRILWYLLLKIHSPDRSMKNLIYFLSKWNPKDQQLERYARLPQQCVQLSIVLKYQYHLVGNEINIGIANLRLLQWQLLHPCKTRTAIQTILDSASDNPSQFRMTVTLLVRAASRWPASGLRTLWCALEWRDTEEGSGQGIEKERQRQENSRVKGRAKPRCKTAMRDRPFPRFHSVSFLSPIRRCSMQ